MGRQRVAFAYMRVCVCGKQAEQMTAATFFHFPLRQQEGGMGGQVSRNQRPSSDLPFSYTCESSNAFAIRQGEEDRERERGGRGWLTYIIVWPKRWDRIAVECNAFCARGTGSTAKQPAVVVWFMMLFRFHVIRFQCARPARKDRKKLRTINRGH